LERHRGSRQDVAGGRATPQLRAVLSELRERARHHLRAAQELLAAAPPAVLPALLPVALAAPTLARMARRDYGPFVPVEVAPWRRQWLIWRAARQPARMFSRTWSGRAGCGDRRRCGPPARAPPRWRSASRSGRPGSWRRAGGSRCAPRPTPRAAIARPPAAA